MDNKQHIPKGNHIDIPKSELDKLLTQLILKQQELWMQYMNLKAQLTQIDNDILELNKKIIGNPKDT